MPYEMQVSPALLKVVSSGKLTSKELLSCADEIFLLEANATAPRNMLTDLTAVTGWDLNAAEMREFARVRDKTVLRHKIKSAIVAPSDVAYGMSRMFEMMRNSPKIQTKIFRDVPSAMKWLREDTAENTSDA